MKQPECSLEVGGIAQWQNVHLAYARSFIQFPIPQIYKTPRPVNIKKMFKNIVV